jgi:hypothetical protein
MNAMAAIRSAIVQRRDTIFHARGLVPAVRGHFFSSASVPAHRVVIDPLSVTAFFEFAIPTIAVRV